MGCGDDRGIQRDTLRYRCGRQVLISMHSDLWAERRVQFTVCSLVGSAALMTVAAFGASLAVPTILVALSVAMPLFTRKFRSSGRCRRCLQKESPSFARHAQQPSAEGGEDVN